MAADIIHEFSLWNILTGGLMPQYDAMLPVPETVDNYKMKIGINGRAFSDPEPDGAVQTGIKLTRYLIRKDDIDVVVYGHPTLSKHFDSDIKIDSTGYVSGSQFFGVLWERTYLPILSQKDNLDVLLCPNGNAPPFPIPGCTVAMYIHDVNAMKGMSSGIHRLYRTSMVPLGAHFADRILTVSEFSKSEICSLLSIQPQKVSVVYNGIDEYFFNDDPGDAFELPDRYILYVGSMNTRKNIGLLIRTYKQMKRNERIPHKLVLIGPKNKTVYKNVDINENGDVITPGFVSKRELKYAYKNADLFVYPSLYEGFGLPPLEAMACGTPTVVSNSSSLPEVVGSAAELFDPGDYDELYEKMYRVLTDESVRISLERSGKKRASYFTWEKSVQQLLTELDLECAVRGSSNPHGDSV